MIRLRVISGALVAVVLLAIVLLPPPHWSLAGLSLILVAAAWEWGGFAAPRSAFARLAYVLVAALLAALWWRVSAGPAGLRGVLLAALAWWLLATLWVFGFPSRAGRAAVAVGGLLALSFAWLALARMRLDWEQGQYAVLYALLIVWLADSGAYFAGRAWGRSKLAPAVSPGKTWAGLWGGFATCALLAVVVAWLDGRPLLPLLGVTLVASLFSVVGDLTESQCKRFAGVKDSGSLIPGHGGVLDRFDSLLAAAPLLMLGVELLPVLRA